VSPDQAIEAVRAATRGAAGGAADRVGDGGGIGAKELEEPARRAARRLVAQGQAEIVQNGRVVDPSTARGPILLRRPRSVG
jgi:hypothetical protein